MWSDVPAAGSTFFGFFPFPRREVNNCFESLRSLRIPPIAQVYLSEIRQLFVLFGRGWEMVTSWRFFFAGRGDRGSGREGIATAGREKRGRNIEFVEVDRAMITMRLKGPAVGRCCPGNAQVTRSTASGVARAGLATAASISGGRIGGGSKIGHMDGYVWLVGRIVSRSCGRCRSGRSLAC